MAFKFGSHADTDVKIDDAPGGTPVSIKAVTTTINEWDTRTNQLIETTPLGSAWPTFRPSGNCSFGSPQLQGIFETGDDSVDSIFANRVPEAPDTATSTLEVTYASGRKVAVETHLKGYTVAASDALTRFTIDLETTGAPTVTGQSV